MNRYVDNLEYSLYNSKFINQTIKRKSLIQKIDNATPKTKDFSVNNNINYTRSPVYNSYTNGHPSQVLYNPLSVKSHNYNDYTDNRNDRLTKSTTTEEKDIGGYYLPQEDIRINQIKVKYGQTIRGIL